MKTLVPRQDRRAAVTRKLIGAAALLIPLAPMVAGATGDITTDLQSAATAAIALMLTAVSVVLVAMFGLPVARKTFSVLKGAFKAG